MARRNLFGEPARRIVLPARTSKYPTSKIGGFPNVAPQVLPFVKSNTHRIIGVEQSEFYVSCLP